MSKITTEPSNKPMLWTIENFLQLKSLDSFTFSISCPTSDKLSDFEAILIPGGFHSFAPERVRIHVKHSHLDSSVADSQDELNFQVNFRFFLVKGSGERCFLHGMTCLMIYSVQYFTYFQLLNFQKLKCLCSRTKSTTTSS